MLRRLTVEAERLREGDVAEALGDIAKEFTSLSLGSYPWFRGLDDQGVNLVASGSDEVALEAIEPRLHEIVRSAGVVPVTKKDDAA